MFLKGTSVSSLGLTPYDRNFKRDNQFEILEKINFDFSGVTELSCTSWVTDGSLTYDINGLNKFKNITKINLHRTYIESLSPLIRS